MASSWDLSLSIDSRGHDDTHVSVVSGPAGSRPHVKVRIGSVVMHCLDGAAAMSAANAWAAARLETSHWLPALQEPRRKAAPAGLGAAYPVGSIIFDGRQRWQVSHTGPALDIAVGPLLVRVHDLTALDTHVRAWTEASALAVRIFPGKAVPFARLVEHERLAALRAADAEAQQRRTRRGRGRTAPPDGPLRGQGRARD